ncbi:MAG: lytic transglycosylase domain-containing protein [Ahrensia sp.]|nr:lytic transglycosylase domain-containing protein [Ahrensia sp.]
MKPASKVSSRILVAALIGASTLALPAVGLNADPAKAAQRSDGTHVIAPASATLKRGLDSLQRGRMADALKARSNLRPGTLERKLMAWAIAVDGRGVDPRILAAIANDLPHWPSAERMRLNVERALARTMDDAQLRKSFSKTAPKTTDASIALAKAHLRAGEKAAARAAIAPVWRENVLSNAQERSILAEFGGVLTRADHRSRVEFLLSKKRLRGAARIAGKAGMTRLVAARTVVERKARNAASALSAVPASQKGSANFLVSKAKFERQRDQITKAARTLRQIDLNKIDPAAADAVWREQRIVVNDLIEGGSVKTAYALASRNTARSAVRRIDAEFLAGWIALRKLKAPDTAASHFKQLLTIAEGPLSRSRGYYWLGRAYEAAGRKPTARAEFAKAAALDTTFYGQLAAIRIGHDRIDISRAEPSNSDRTRFPQYELVQAIDKLESAGHDRLAAPFYDFLSRKMGSAGELAILAARAERQGDFRLSLQVGKRAHRRGFEVDTLAWPIGAIPRNTKTGGAGLALAYAIARQESAFQVDARSSANALGLLQLLPATAKRTARSIGIGYSRSRLVQDASYNARLGTAFLSQQLDNFGGSYVLTFAAYNAGPRRASEWIERYGDPRGRPLDDVVDWIEKIPFGETRNYVMRVMENYQVYKARLNGAKLTIEQDLRAGRTS